MLYYNGKILRPTTTERTILREETRGTTGEKETQSSF